MISPSSESHIFFTDEKPSGFKYSSEFVFNTQSYLDAHDAPACSFYLINTFQENIAGIINFFEKDGQLTSPGRASFGGFEFHENSVSAKSEFIDYVSSELDKRNKKVYIRSFPDAYNPEDALLIHNKLLESGFSMARQEPSHHIEVDVDSFVSRIHSMEKRKLNSALKQKFEFKEESPVNLPEIYEFIYACREEKGQTISMSLQQILEVSRKLPGIFRIFTVRAEEEIIAASIMVVINHNILYNFYPASPIKWNKESPMVFLLSGIYEYCQNHGYSILDLGTSWLDSGPNESLIRFKENVGGKLSFRNSFLKE